jgi:uncharacterized DUF497 family protein
MIMNFEWDLLKNAKNKAKHDIDFDTAKGLWDDENRVEIHAPHPVEDRWIIIGSINDRLWTAIYTMRGETIRIISVRRSREKEAALYEDQNKG